MQLFLAQEILMKPQFIEPQRDISPTKSSQFIFPEKRGIEHGNFGKFLLGIGFHQGSPRNSTKILLKTWVSGPVRRVSLNIGYTPQIVALYY